MPLTAMSLRVRRLLILVFPLLTLGLLIPGLVLPVITIKGILKPDGIAQVAPLLLEQGMDAEAMKGLESMLNPNMVTLVKATGSDLRKMMVDKLSPQIVASLQKSSAEIEVYDQTRSIISSVQHLYEVDSPLPATLILIFSIVVPLTKTAMVLCAALMSNATRRRRTIGIVETIAKWSMADVFVVAIFIAYLAAQASQVPPGDSNFAPPMVAFKASFGSGFYWFTGYCLFSQAAQQLTRRWFQRVAAMQPNS